MSHALRRQRKAEFKAVRSRGIAPVVLGQTLAIVCVTLYVIKIY